MINKIIESIKSNKSIKLLLGGVLVLAILGGVLYYGHYTKSQKLVKGWNLPTVKYINESELLENKIPKKYREVASIKSLEEYLKIKKDLAPQMVAVSAKKPWFSVSAETEKFKRIDGVDIAKIGRAHV